MTNLQGTAGSDFWKAAVVKVCSPHPYSYTRARERSSGGGGRRCWGEVEAVRCASGLADRWWQENTTHTEYMKQQRFRTRAAQGAAVSGAAAAAQHATVLGPLQVTKDFWQTGMMAVPTAEPGRPCSPRSSRRYQARSVRALSLQPQLHPCICLTACVAWERSHGRWRRHTRQLRQHGGAARRAGERARDGHGGAGRHPIRAPRRHQLRLPRPAGGVRSARPLRTLG